MLELKSRAQFAYVDGAFHNAATADPMGIAAPPSDDAFGHHPGVAAGDVLVFAFAYYTNNVIGPPALSGFSSVALIAGPLLANGDGFNPTTPQAAPGDTQSDLYLHEEPPSSEIALLVYYGISDGTAASAVFTTPLYHYADDNCFVAVANLRQSVTLPPQNVQTTQSGNSNQDVPPGCAAFAVTLARRVRNPSEPVDAPGFVDYTNNSAPITQANYDSGLYTGGSTPDPGGHLVPDVGMYFGLAIASRDENLSVSDDLALWSVRFFLPGVLT